MTTDLSDRKSSPQPAIEERPSSEDDRSHDVEERLRLKTGQYAHLERQVEEQLRAEVDEREALDRLIGDLAAQVDRLTWRATRSVLEAEPRMEEHLRAEMAEREALDRLTESLLAQLDHVGQQATWTQAGGADQTEEQLRAEVEEREALDRLMGELLAQGLSISPVQPAAPTAQIADLQRKLQQAERELEALRRARPVDESRLSYQMLMGMWRVAPRVIPPRSRRSAVLRGFTWPVKAALRASKR